MGTGRQSAIRIEKITIGLGSCQLCLLPAEYRVTLRMPEPGRSSSSRVYKRKKHGPGSSVFAYCGYHFILEVTDNPVVRDAITSESPELLGLSQTVTGSALIPKIGIEDLLPQLEEAKFMRFFREFALDDMEPERTTVPLDFPDAEVFLTTIEDDHACVVGSTFQQVAHLPAALWHSDIVGLFLEKSLRQAFKNLGGREDLVRVLDGSRTVQRAYELFGVREEHFPEDYALFTNLPNDVLIDREEISQYARDLCHRMLDIPRQSCPYFHLVTPESVMSASGANQVKQFLIELLNTPSGYYFVAREGRISVASTTEHGTFFAPGPGGATVDPGLSAVITSTLPTSDVLSEIETLVNIPGIQERDLQGFFESHPELLFAFDEKYCEIRPHVCLVDNKGDRLIPDFMARLHGSNLWDVIELKMPRDPLTVLHGRTEKPSAQAARAIAELLAYRDFFAIRSNRQRIENRFDIAPYEPCLVLVIGRGRSNDRYEWESCRPGFPKVQIVSYDYLFERAREIRAALSSEGDRL